MLAGQKKQRAPRNYVVLAMVRAARRSVAHGRTKKADRRRDQQNMWRELVDC